MDWRGVSMELSKYRIPFNWFGKGQTWDNPKPDLADYVMAIRDAIIERCIVANGSPSDAVLSISPDVIVTAEQGNALLNEIRYLIPYFINFDYPYAEDYSDFPHYWTWDEMVNQPGHEIFRRFTVGELFEDSITTFKAMFKVLNLLRYRPVEYPEVKLYEGSGSRHDPPFNTSVNDALNEAAEIDEDDENEIPNYICSWSGNTHYHDQVNKDGEIVKEDGYCGYANQRYFKLVRFRKRIPNRGCRLVTIIIANKLNEPLSYSSELEKSTFDSGNSGIKEGVNILQKTVVANDSEDVEYLVGLENNIPLNRDVPKSHFDHDDSSKTIRRSTIRGFEATVYMCIDYGVYSFSFFDE